MSSATTTTTTNVIDLDANLQQRRPNLNEQDNNIFASSVASSVGNYVIISILLQ
jgi:hypothetical protein